MATLKQILQTIVDHPGLSGAELGEMLDMDAKDIQPRIHPYISDGRVRCEKKPMDGAASINLYYASPELVREFDGTNQTVTKATRKTASLPAASDGFVCGFSTAGRLTITKGRKTVDLTREETARLLAFVDAINIEAISGSQA